MHSLVLVTIRRYQIQCLCLSSRAGRNAGCLNSEDQLRCVRDNYPKWGALLEPEFRAGHSNLINAVLASGRFWIWR